MNGNSNGHKANPTPQLPQLRVGSILRAGSHPILWRGSALGIAFLGAAIAARLLGPEKLGVSALSSVLIAQAVLVGTLNQDAHFVRAAKRETTAADPGIHDLIVFRFATSAIASLLAGLAGYGFVLKHESTAATATVVLVFLVSSSPTWVLQSAKKQLVHLKGQFIQHTVTLLLILAFLSSESPAGSEVALACVGSFIMWCYTWSAAGKGISISKKIRWTKVLAVAWEGRWLTLTGAVIYLYTAVDQPVVFAVLGDEALGQYRVALQVVAAVAAFSAIAPLYVYPKLLDALKISRAALVDLVRSLEVPFFGTATIVGLIIVGFIALSFEPVFGPRFKPALVPCLLLVTAKLVALANVPYIWALRALGKDRPVLFVMLATAALSVVANIVLLPRLGLPAAGMVAIAAEAVVLLSSAVILGRSQRTS